MLIIAGSVRIDPARRDEAIAAAREMMRETHKEPGNRAYTFSADFDDAAVFHLFELWDSQDALDAHFQSPHMASFQQALGRIGRVELEAQKYEISGVGPVRG